MDVTSSTAWNIDVLVDSVNEIVSSCYLNTLPAVSVLHFNGLTYLLLQMQAPRTNWTCVMENLDHEGFNTADERPFRC
jgi:hypothetical protein